MFEWILNNISTIIVGLILLAVVTLIIVKYIKDTRQGKHSCSGCAGCALSGKCPHANMKKVNRKQNLKIKA